MFSALAFLLLSIATVPITTGVVQQKTEYVNQQPSIMVRQNYALIIRRDTIYDYSVSIDLSIVGFSVPSNNIKNPLTLKKPLMPVITHRPFT